MFTGVVKFPSNGASGAQSGSFTTNILLSQWPVTVSLHCKCIDQCCTQLLRAVPNRQKNQIVVYQPLNMCQTQNVAFVDKSVHVKVRDVVRCTQNKLSAAATSRIRQPPSRNDRSTNQVRPSRGVCPRSTTRSLNLACR